MTARTKSQRVEHPVTNHGNSDSTHLEKSLCDLSSPLPENVDQWNSLAVDYYTNGDYNKSVKTYQEALILYPNTSFLLNNLAAAQSCMSQHGKALQNVIRSLAVTPNYNSALMNLEAIITKIEKHDQVFIKNVLNKRVLSNAYRLLGNAYFDNKIIDNAVSCLRNALIYATRTNKPELYNEISLVFSHIKNYEQAFSFLNKALQINPRHVGIISNKGYLHYLMGNFSAAEKEYNKAIKINSEYVPARVNRSMLRLLSKHYTQAWPDYEYRLKALKNPDLVPHLPTDKKLHQQDIIAKSILVLAEQGLGDFIQFSRYLSLLKKKVGPSGKIYVVCPKSLRCLFSDSPDEFTLIENINNVDFHYYIYIMSLPGYFGMANIPPPLLKDWPASFRAPNRPKRLENHTKHIGLVWAGNAAHDRDTYRSIPLAYYEVLGAVKNTVFHSLQFGGHGHQCQRISKNIDIIDHCADLGDFSDTASLITELDLVICIDSSVAHVSATLGVETWLLISYVPDWRWGLTESKTDWYPSIRIFRQKQLNNWSGIIEDVALELDRFVNT